MFINKIATIRTISNISIRLASNFGQPLISILLNLFIFSGDRKETVLEIGKNLKFEFDKLKWGMLPHQKLENIEILKHNHKVAMVGDGINDAPALASSDLGIAVGSGTQIAKANADVVLMGDKLIGLHLSLIHI